jgi:hypothetical protein
LFKRYYIKINKLPLYTQISSVFFWTEVRAISVIGCIGEITANITGTRCMYSFCGGSVRAVKKFLEQKIKFFSIIKKNF